MSTTLTPTPVATAPIPPGKRSLLYTLMQIVKLTRPKQWVKNVFVFAGLVFAKQVQNLDKIGLALAAFVLFSAISGAVYIINDLVDVEKDRQHPKKRNRPLASGKLSIRAAIVALFVILAVTLPLSFALNPIFFVCIIAYFGLNLAYSFYLKHVVILDVFCIALGFVLRAVAGAVAIRVDVSPWLYLCTLLLALFLGLAKRRHELVLLAEGAGSHRRILEEYSSELVQEMISVVTASTVIAYSLYTINADNLPRNHAMAVTIPFVIYAIFRYLYIIYKKEGGGSPEEVLLGDIPFLACIVIWGVTALGILYFPWDTFRLQ